MGGGIEIYDMFRLSFVRVAPDHVEIQITFHLAQIGKGLRKIG